MPEMPDKPAGSEPHPTGANPARQGPGQDKPDKPNRKRPLKDRQPPPEASPGEPGIPNPKQGKV